MPSIADKGCASLIVSSIALIWAPASGPPAPNVWGTRDESYQYRGPYVITVRTNRGNKA
jgi:hypothetical protein